MTKIIFVRHAQPVHSHLDDRTRPLTEEGLRDTALVFEMLKDRNVDIFYCSPYQRSLDTIRGTAEAFGLPIHTDERLRERQTGAEGNGNMRAAQSPLRMRWADHNWHEPGGESIAMVQSRNVAAVQEILDANPGKTIVIGTHGTALSSILNYYRPEFGVEDFLRIIDWMPYIVELDFEGRELTELRELAHIEKEYPGKQAFHGRL